MLRARREYRNLFAWVNSVLDAVLTVRHPYWEPLLSSITFAVWNMM